MLFLFTEGGTIIFPSNTLSLLLVTAVRASQRTTSVSTCSQSSDTILKRYPRHGKWIRTSYWSDMSVFRRWQNRKQEEEEIRWESFYEYYSINLHEATMYLEMNEK